MQVTVTLPPGTQRGELETGSIQCPHWHLNGDPMWTSQSINCNKSFLQFEVILIRNQSRLIICLWRKHLCLMQPNWGWSLSPSSLPESDNRRGGKLSINVYEGLLRLILLREGWHSGWVCWHYHTKVLQPGWLKQQKFMFTMMSLLISCSCYLHLVPLQYSVKTFMLRCIY